MLFVIMSQIRPFQGLGFSTKILLSSVASGATPFQRKGAINCGGAATFPSAAKPLSPPERSEHNPSTQPAPSGAPLFLIAAETPPQPSALKAPSNLAHRPSAL